MFKKLLCVLAMLVSGAVFAAVEVNQADQATLESIKGIGPGVSQRILDARKQGNFKDWVDLIDRVKGVGKGNASKFAKEGLTVNGASYVASAAPAKVGKADKTKQPKAEAK
jgi:competence protein ComEA